MSAEPIERYDHLGRAHPGGVPDYEQHKTGKIIPNSNMGQEREFILRVEADETLHEVRVLPIDDFIGPVPPDFYPAELYSRIPAEWPKNSEEEQPWGEPIDRQALLPCGRDNELLAVNTIIVTNVESHEQKAKGIRSKKLWLYLGGAAATGAVIGLTGIVVRHHTHKAAK